jgi:hypothetical protein
MRTIRRISIGSAFKVGAVLYGLLWVIVGGLLLLAQLAFGGMLAGAAGGRQGAGMFGLFLGGGIVFYVIGIVLYALFGGIFSAIAALFYNFAAGWVGGLQVEME